jgi:hypothetical protein
VLAAAQAALRQLLLPHKDTPGQQQQQDENICVVLRTLERLLRVGEEWNSGEGVDERSAELASVYISLCQVGLAQCVERPLILAYLLRLARMRPSFVASTAFPPSV